MTDNVTFNLIGLGLGLYGLLNLYALFGSDQLIFLPQEQSYVHLPSEVRIESGNGEEICAVYLEHPQAEFTILFSHGNSEDLGNTFHFMKQYYDRGYSVLMYDYRGYGSSDGEPSTHKAKQDIVAAYEWLVTEKGIAPKSIIAQGRSLGGGPSTWLAARYEVGGLVIESTFVSAFRVKTTWPFLPWDKFNSLRSIRNVKCPVLVMHGREDEIIPFWHGEKLYATASAPKMNLWIDGARHNDYAYIAGDAYLDTFQRFVKTKIKGLPQ